MIEYNFTSTNGCLNNNFCYTCIDHCMQGANDVTFSICMHSATIKYFKTLELIHFQIKIPKRGQVKVETLYYHT